MALIAVSIPTVCTGELADAGLAIIPASPRGGGLEATITLATALTSTFTTVLVNRSAFAEVIRRILGHPNVVDSGLPRVEITIHVDGVPLNLAATNNAAGHQQIELEILKATDKASPTHGPEMSDEQ